MVIKCPCKDCEERYLECHSHCEAYQEYKQKKAEYSNAVFKAKLKRKKVNDYYAEAKGRLKKGRK